MQVVGYETSPAPKILLAADGELRRRALTQDERLALTLDDRHCAGVITDGHHSPCPVSEAPYCETHTTRWACARCTGDCSLPLPACQEEHAVYLAGFAPNHWKVGVTRSWRLETRLKEQGADRAAHIRTVETGRRARRIEAGIAEDLPDRVRIPTKVAGLHRSIDADAWEELITEFDPIETYEFDYGIDVPSQPISATIATGSIIGVKGRVLVLERDGTLYGVDLRDLVGHDIREEPSSRDRQTSFSSFG